MIYWDDFLDDEIRGFQVVTESPMMTSERGVLGTAQVK